MPRAIILILAACLLPICYLPRALGQPKTLQGVYPGPREWIHGYGNENEWMVYCPTNCTGNSDFSTHVGGDPRYSKFWDVSGWLSPQYSDDTKQETDNGFQQDDPHFIQSGVSMLCKKPYDVCDYPNGDVYVRQALETLLRRTTDKTCQDSMKIFLCALYRRKCGMETDPNRASPTFRNRAVKPVCWTQCWNAYTDCFYNSMHATLMCSEYIKAGWVTYEWDEDSARGCDSKGSRVRSTMWAAGLAAAASILTAYASA